MTVHPERAVALLVCAIQRILCHRVPSLFTIYRPRKPVAPKTVAVYPMIREWAVQEA